MVAVAGGGRPAIQARSRARLIDGEAGWKFCIVHLLNEAEIHTGISIVSRPQVGGRHVLQRGSRQGLPVAFKSGKEENLVLLDRSARCKPPLVLHFALARRAGEIVLEGVRIHERALVGIAPTGVVLITAAPAHHVDRAAAGPAVASIVSGGHHVYFFYAVDVGRDVPFACIVIVVGELAGDVRSVECELVVSDDAAADGILIRDVIAGGAMTSTLSVLCLRELRARGRPDQVIGHPAAQWNILQRPLIDHGAARTSGGFELWRRRADDHLLRDGANLQLEILIESLRGEQQHLILHSGFETIGRYGDLVGSRQYVGDVVDGLIGCPPCIACSRLYIHCRDSSVLDCVSGLICHLTRQHCAKILRAAIKSDEDQHQQTHA